MGAIPTRKPRRRVINVRSLVHAFDGPERSYPYYTFSARQFFARPNADAGVRDLTVLTPIPGSVPAGTVGSAYAGVNWTEATASTPLHWSVIAGELPAGLTLDSATGSITGTPTFAGVFAYTIEVTGAPVRGTEVGSASSSITVT